MICHSDIDVLSTNYFLLICCLSNKIWLLQKGHWYQWQRSVLGSGVNDLLLEVGWLGESESDLVGGELVVAVGDGSASGFHGLSVEWVEEDLSVSSSVKGDSGGLSSDVGWEAL